jgi:hypothetical protein
MALLCSAGLKKGRVNPAFHAGLLRCGSDGAGGSWREGHGPVWILVLARKGSPAGRRCYARLGVDPIVLSGVIAVGLDRRGLFGSIRPYRAWIRKRNVTPGLSSFVGLHPGL